MKRTLSLLTILLIGVSSWAKKTSNPDIDGTIVDAQGQPLEFVNISLLSGKDSTYISGATSAEMGKFHIVAPATDGILRISFVGYETRYVNVSDIGNGIITLKDDTQMLKEVTVNGQLPKTKLTGNSMITKVEGTVLEKSGSLKEMLTKVPGMTQKGDDLEVLGKGTPIYYINGRKMQDADELKRLRSEEIASVEVITNPGAEYDATVSAVVRIKTVKRKGDGFGFDIHTGNHQSLAFGYSAPFATTNLRYRHNDFDVFGMVNYWEWTSVNDSRPDQSSFIKQGNDMLNIMQNMSLRYNWIGKGVNYNLGFNWQITPDHSIGARVERHDKFGSKTEMFTETTIDRFINGKATSETEYNKSDQNDRIHQPYNIDGNVYYNGKAGNLGIDFNFDFLTNKSNEATNIKDMDGKNNTSVMEQEQHTSSDMLATKLVLSYPIWKGQLQAGTEMSFVTRKSRYSISGYPLPATESDVKEKNIAAFMQYGCEIPKFGNLSAGLRYEHVGFDYTDKINDTKSMSRYTDELFPSLSWSRQFGAIQTSLAYSIKTVRPNYNMLDEGIMYINPYSLQQGDPQLKNAKMQEISLNARWKWLNLFVAYERRDDAQSQWSYIYNDEGVILIKNINLDKPVRNLAMFLTGSPTFGVYSANWTAGWQKFFYTQELADPREATGKREISYKKPLMFFDLNNTFRLKHSWQLEANMNIVLKGDWMNFHITNNTYNLGFTVQKCWLKNDALCFRVSVFDVLQRSPQIINMDCGYYVLDQWTKNNNHRLDVSLRYTFNASQSKYKGTGAGKDAQSRMKD
jgi:hypothetical protein